MMKYVKCPICELNYIEQGKKYCMACDPKIRGKLISDTEESNEEYRQQKWKQHAEYKKSMQEFYSIRYNCKPN